MSIAMSRDSAGCDGTGMARKPRSSPVSVARARPDGLFSNVASVIGVLHRAEQQRLTPVVRFDSGLYLEPGLGPNWWDYYFGSEKGVRNEWHCRLLPLSLRRGGARGNSRIGRLSCGAGRSRRVVAGIGSWACVGAQCDPQRLSAAGKVSGEQRGESAATRSPECGTSMALAMRLSRCSPATRPELPYAAW